MARRHIKPHDSAPIANERGGVTQAWGAYLDGIEEVSGRVAANVAPLGASPSNAQIATAFNSLLTALQDANLQETS